MADQINPTHYKALDPEPIVAIEGWGLGFCLGNAVKYIARAGRKTESPIDDLKKARWYIDREINRLTGSSVTQEKAPTFKPPVTPPSHGEGQADG